MPTWPPASIARAARTPARPRSPPRLARERATALQRGLVPLEPLRRFGAQLALVGQVVTPRAARVVAEQLARLADRDPRRVVAVELAQLDLVAVVVAHEVGERAVGVVVGRRDV